MSWLRLGQVAKLIKRKARQRVLAGLVDPHSLKEEIIRVIEHFGYVAAFPPMMACGQVLVHRTPSPKFPVALKLPMMLDIGVMCRSSGRMVDTAIRIGPMHPVEQCALALQDWIHLHHFKTYGQVCQFIYEFITGRGLYVTPKMGGHGIEPFKLHSGVSIGVTRAMRRNPAPVKPGDVFTVEPLIFQKQVPFFYRRGNCRIIGPGTVPYCVTCEVNGEQEVYLGQQVPFSQCEHSYLVGDQGELIRLT